MLLEYSDDYGTPHLTLRRCITFDWIDWLWHAVAEMQFIHQNHYKLQVGFQKTGTILTHTRPEKHLDPSYCIWFFTKIYHQDHPGLEIFEMMFSPPIPRCPFFVSIFKWDYMGLSSNIIHKSQRFWWYHPVTP